MKQTIRYLTLLIWCHSSLLTANESSSAKTAEKKPDASGHGEKSGEKADAAATPVRIGPKRDYNPGKVLPFPSFQSPRVGSSDDFEFSLKKGHAVMMIFVASWCEPCQILMNDFKQLAKKYSNASTDVFFIVAHDTKDDAAGFLKEHQVTQTAIMANVDLLINFKNPELPSVYMGDKWGYLAGRFIKVKKQDIDKIDKLMGDITAL
jgi:thiol-disulfide isomerase/thioredoxin